MLLLADSVKFFTMMVVVARGGVGFPNDAYDKFNVEWLRTRL